MNIRCTVFYFLCIFGLSLTCVQNLHSQTSQPLQTALNIKHFQPTMDALSLSVTERSLGLQTGDINLSLMVDFAFDTLQQEVQGESFLLVDQMSSGQMFFTFGLWGHLNVAISQKLHLMNGDFDGKGQQTPFATDGFGDTHFLLKGIILDADHSVMGLAVLLDSAWSLAEPPVFVSHNQSPVLTPWLIIDKSWRYVDTALNLGYAMQEAREVSSDIILPDMTQVARGQIIKTAAEFKYRWGLAGKYKPGFFHQHVEIIGAQALGDAQRAQNLELVNSLRLLFDRGSHLTLGIANGLTDGYASPAWRVFMGITFHPTDADSDQDGIIDDEDKCPNEAEDKDNFQDQDGCPDLDNDQDGIQDLFDQCPNQPEDVNGYQDQDGCPDAQRDLDRDGIIDSKDECISQPEDKDNYEDQDGCPDPDNDQDNILDRKDQCPNRAEDYDSFQDQDGCPDPDNDQDGIADVRDSCPFDPEDKDGDRDQDGCPEEAPAKVKIKQGKLSIQGKVYFKTGKAVIKSSSYMLLLEIARFINEHPSIQAIEIQGHTDSRGSERANRKLSKRRARAVMNYLIEEGSVDAKRLSSKGYGSSQPINPENNAKAWSENRRVEFKIQETE